MGFRAPRLSSGSGIGLLVRLEKRPLAKITSSGSGRFYGTSIDRRHFRDSAIFVINKEEPPLIFSRLLHELI